MTTNIQDQILEAQLTSTGVYNSQGVAIPEPVPLVSPFTAAVAAAVLLNPPVLSYSGTVSGWDFVFGGPTLISNLEKLSLLTITGEIASAFNDMSLSIKQLTINGGVTASFNRFKLHGNLTVNGNIINSFQNSVLKQDNTCGKLILNGNIAIDTCLQTTLNLQTFVLSLPVANPPTTVVPTIATTLATYNAYYADITTDYDPCASLDTLNTNITTYLGGLVQTDPFTQTILDNVIALFGGAYVNSTGYSFWQSVITYHSISITSSYIATSFLASHLTFDTLEVTADVIMDSFLQHAKLNGFNTVESKCNSGYRVKCWKPAKSIVINVSNENNYPLFIASLLLTSNVQVCTLEFSGAIIGRLFLNSKVISDNLIVNSTLNMGLLEKADVICFDKLEVNNTSLVTSEMFTDSTVRAGLISLNGIFDIDRSIIEANKLIYKGIANSASEFFVPKVLSVDYICIDSTFQTQNFLNTSIINAKEIDIKSDLSQTTTLFSGGSLTADLIRFENGITFPTSGTPMLMIFDVCDMQISKCKTTGVIVSGAFNGSLLEVQKLWIAQDVTFSFNSSTLVGQSYKSGAAMYSFANSLVVEKEFELSKKVNKCDVQQALMLNAGDPTLPFSPEMTALNTILTNVLAVTPQYNTTFVSDVLKWSAFDRSTLTHVMNPDFIDFDITVTNLFLQGVIPTVLEPSYQFLLDAIIGMRTKAVIVNGTTITPVLADAKMAKLKQLKLVGTATISQIPITILKSLHTLRYCGTTKPTAAERATLKKYHLDC